MDRLTRKADEVLDEKIRRLGKIFPECLTEMRDEDGKLKLAFDVELLKNILLKRVPDEVEAYRFNWVGKNKARAEAYERSDKTLRPRVEDSVDWDATGNLYIEGDNLEVLKLLQYSYMGKVKLIYIDPPYNTGRDFIYRDRFEMDKAEYAAEVGLFDDEENINFVENSETNPRFHSDWCSMMYARLLLARNLLTDDGAIFISIDDNEQENLRKMCDEVFGEANFVANVIWEKKYSPQNDATWLSDSHDFILGYARNKNIWRPNLLPRTAEMDARYKNPDNDPRGPWMSDNFTCNKTAAQRPNLFFSITDPSTGKIYKCNPNRVWRFDKNKIKSMIEENRIWFGAEVPRVKKFLSEVKQGSVSKTLWFRAEVGDNQEAKRDVINIFDGASVFATPKPVRLIDKILRLATNKDSLVMDFFSGSATTAHAVMSLNAEDGGNRRFIMVQLPEACDPKSEAFKAGYENICEIGKERIRRAGAKIKADAPLTTTHLDVGFRVLRLDESNFRHAQFDIDELTQDALADAEENIKPERTPLDLLFGCLIDWGVELNLPYTSEQFDGATIHIYDAGGEQPALIACFDRNISESVIEHIAKKKPLRVVFRDACFPSDAAKINAEEIFKLHLPNEDTDKLIRVI